MSAVRNRPRPPAGSTTKAQAAGSEPGSLGLARCFAIVAGTGVVPLMCQRVSRAPGRRSAVPSRSGHGSAPSCPTGVGTSAREAVPFARTYGSRHRSCYRFLYLVECHHVLPLHVAGEGRTKLSDLALICANCHRMIHRRAPGPTPGELRASIEQKNAADRRATGALARPRRAADEQMPNT
ncbi:HNH endonuclease [Streptomyces sp. NPDC059218]|uniref:HNH endonuclease n=1 Tax=unclassified Streptomyces TaxID=2593676 RepID=UPI0036BB03F8